MEIENADDLFKITIKKAEKELTISLFEEIEAELCDRLLHGSSPEDDDETDGAIEFIKGIVDKVRSDFRWPYGRRKSKKNSWVFSLKSLQFYSA